MKFETLFFTSLPFVAIDIYMFSKWHLSEPCACADKRYRFTNTYGRHHFQTRTTCCTEAQTHTLEIGFVFSLHDILANLV